MNEVTIGGASSRRLPDRTLNRVIEEAWARETRSPSNMIQELSSRFRQNGLQVVRHRRGMLFVSPIRVRAFVHEQAGVSPSVNAVLETLSGAPGINRKQLFEKLLGASAMEDTEPSRLALASDLRWLINVGYVIEFNDGSLDLPRGKSKPSQVLAAAEADAHKFLQFRHPNSLVSQIWRENARHHFRHVPAYAAFFLGQTTAMNDAAMHGPRSCNITNS